VTGQDVQTIAVPGRVNLIGEHIDYHRLEVMPMALERRVRIAFRGRDDNRIRAASANYPAREFVWERKLTPGAAGDWENYVKAAAQAVGDRWGVGRGLDAELEADLPPAAGLSSSSALLVAVTLALLRVNGHVARFEELMEVLPEGEYFVGTRGGGMDHAAVLGSERGCASLIAFEPVGLRPVPIPADWAFLVAHSMATAEKSGPARDEYNARRAAGNAALQRLGFGSYREAIEGRPFAELRELAGGKLADEREHDSFLHVTGEAARVHEAVRAMEGGDAEGFGILLQQSHASLRDLLRVSSAALDRLVEAAVSSGALGARLSGAGFGGCAVVFCRRAEREMVRRGLIERFYATVPGFCEEEHLIDAEAGAGALALLRG
jgi:galactokinase